MHPIQKKWKIILDKTSVISLLPVVNAFHSDSVSEVNVTEVSTAVNHYLVLLNDGTVMAMGCNQYGQLGNATSTREQSAFQVVTNEEGESLSHIKAISAGGYHNIALDHTGQVWAWGRNREGQIGIGLANGPECVHVATRVVFPQEVNIVAIAAGVTFSLALDEQGHVWAWGGNDEGQLGIGYDNIGKSQYAPLQVTTNEGALSCIQSISAGQYHSLALDKDGQIWGWGANWNGAMGFDTTMNFSKIEGEIKLAWGKDITFNPDKVIQTHDLYTWMDFMVEYYTHDMIWMCAKRMTYDQDGFTEVVAGTMQSQAVKRDRSVWAWGYVEDPTSDEGRCFKGEHLGYRTEYLEDRTFGYTAGLNSTIPGRGSKWIWTLCEDEIPLPPIKMIDLQDFHSTTGERFMICRSRSVTPWVLENTYIEDQALII